MPSSAPIDAALRDIRYNIRLATQWADELDRLSFQDNLKTLYAVTRCLEIISEASRRLPDDIKARHPSIAWREMAAAGNVYRHEYEAIEAQFVWETVRRDLPPLLAAIEQELLSG